MKKTIIMTVGAALVFAGVGFGAGTLLGGSAEAKDVVKNEELAKLDDAHSDSEHGDESSKDDAHSDSEHGDSEHGDSEHGDDKKKKEPVVVEIGRVMVPIYNPRSITYVIAELGLSIKDPKQADNYKDEGYVNKVRNDVLEVMIKMSETEVFNELYVDTDAISFSLHQALKKDYDYIDEVLFLNFVKQELKRG